MTVDRTRSCATGRTTEGSTGTGIDYKAGISSKLNRAIDMQTQVADRIGSVSGLNVTEVSGRTGDIDCFIPCDVNRMGR